MIINFVFDLYLLRHPRIFLCLSGPSSPLCSFPHFFLRCLIRKIVVHSQEKECTEENQVSEYVVLKVYGFIHKVLFLLVKQLTLRERHENISDEHTVKVHQCIRPYHEGEL